MGNIITGNAKQTQQVIEHGALNILKTYLTHEKVYVRKEACWILSNIAAGTQYQNRCLIQSGFLPILIQMMKNDINEVSSICCLSNLFKK